jgi:hypothetical protein
VKATDLCFHILIAEERGSIFFIDEVMAVYRRHAGGVTDEKANYIYHLRKNIHFYSFLRDYLQNKNHSQINLAKTCLKEARINLFYQIRYKKRKTISDLIELLKLTFILKKFNVLKLFSR